MGSRILIVEDENDLAESLQIGLQEEGFEVGVARTGEVARRLFDHSWDVIVLDLGLPDISGENLLNYLKQRPNSTRILVLSASGSVQTKVSMFQQGCDDYLTKPCAFEELLERIKALLRRGEKLEDESYRYDDLTFDNATMVLHAGTRSVQLTPKESAICRLLMSKPEAILSRRDILQGVWAMKSESTSNLVGIHVFKLRRKFEQLGRGEWFQTVRFEGFRLSKPNEIHLEEDSRKPHSESL